MLASASAALALLSLLPTALAAGKPYYTWKNLPNQTEPGQVGYNLCGTSDSKSAKCQTLLINSLNDFCLWGGQKPKSIVGDAEPYVVGWCLKDGHGSRLFPKGTIKAAHMLRTPYFVQITGRANFPLMNIDASDETGRGGGELDPHGATGLGNPIGGVMFSNALRKNNKGDPVMAGEWQMFLEHDRFCVRMCNPALSRDLQKAYCPHRYDILGCEWNEPANYGPGFDSCIAENGLPPGLYPPPGASPSTTSFKGWSTFAQGMKPTPKPHPAPASSKCTTYSQLTYTTYAKAPKKPAGATATPKPTKTSSKAKRAAMETQVVRRAGAL